MFWSKSPARLVQRQGRPSNSIKQAVLAFEDLESRVVPTVAVLPVNASHSFLSQLGAATSGDTLQLSPGATLGTLGTTGQTTAASSVNDTTIKVNAAFAPGQFITISHSGDTSETDLVDAVSTPVSGVYTLTLHTPLADTHQSGSTVTALANTLGIDKGITIAGVSSSPASTLLSGITLDYLTQNVAPAPDALTHLALTAVEGVTSSNLSITGDTFTITSGTTDPINITSGGSLTISGDSFTVGSSATLASVVVGQTSAGTMTFSGNTIAVTGNLSAAAVSLTSTSGAIALSSDNLSVSGTEGADGISASTGNSVSVSGANLLKFTGTVTGNGLDVVAGTAASVSGVTADFTGDVGFDGITVSASGMLTASNLTVMVGGNVLGTGGDGAAIGINGTGAGTVSNLTATVDHSAFYGLYLSVDGNLTVGGTEKVAVSGAVTDTGMYIYSSDGTIDVTTGLSVSLGSTATYGLEVEADEGNLTVTGTVSVAVTGAVSSEGLYLYGDTNSVEAVTLTLGSTTEYGVDIEGYQLTTHGTITTTIAGAVVDEAVYLESYDGQLTVEAPIIATLQSSAVTGVELYSEENAIVDLAPITVHITGDSSSYGIYAYGLNNVTLSGSQTVSIGGTAYYGTYIESSDGTITDTAGLSVAISKAITQDAAYFDSTSAQTLANITIMAAAIGSGEGLYAYEEDGAGPLSVTNVNVTANGGTSSAYGVDLESYYGTGTISASGITVHMNANANTGVYIYAEYSNGVSLSNVTATITGSASYGIYVDADYAGNVDLANLSTTIGGASSYGVYAYSTANLTVNGAISATLTGAVADEGIYLEAYYGNLSIISPLTVQMASTSYSGIECYADEGNVTDTAAATVNAKGNVSEYGVYDYANGNLSISGKTTAVLGGTASYGIYWESDQNAVTCTGPTTISVTGSVNDAGAYVDGETNVTIGSLAITLADGTEYGAELDNSYGSLSVSNLNVHVTGAASSYGVYLYSDENITTSNISATVTGGAGYGIYAQAYYGSLSMTGTTVSVGGNSTTDGADLNAGSTGTISNLKLTVGSAANYALNATSKAGDLSLSSSTVTQSGAVSQDGVLLSATGGNLTVSASTVTLKGAVAGDALNVSSTNGNLTLTNDKVTASAGASSGIVPTAGGTLSIMGTSVTLSGSGTSPALLLNNTSGSPQLIENDTFNTSGTGYGLEIEGGTSQVVALIQGDNFQHNLVGVAITNDGEIDLGGGLLGSLGKNNFDGFTGTSGNFAITLMGTSAVDTVYALDNLFSVSNPESVIQDGTHNGGTGVIKL